MRSFRDEHGLVGKILVIWLLVIVGLCLAAIDAGSIVLARIRTADVAGDAASAGAEAFRETGKRRDALGAALSAVVDRDEDARIADFEVTRRGRVTVVIDDLATTLLVGRFGLLDELRTVTASESSGG